MTEPDKLEIENKISFDGFEVSYNLSIAKGGKPPILLLGGAFQNSKAWNPFKRHFHERNSILTIDVPGTFGADYLPRSYDFHWLSNCIKKVLDTLKIRKINLLALSYSTPLGVCFTSSYPEYVNRLALGGAVATFDHHMRQDVQRTAELLEENNIDHFVRTTVCLCLMNLDPRIYIERRDQVLKVMYKQMGSVSTTEVKQYIENTFRILDTDYLLTLQKPECLTLGFTGEHDILTKPQDCKDYLAMFPNNIFTLIKDTDHLCFLEKMKTILRLTDTFFNDELPVAPDDCLPFQNQLIHETTTS